MSQENNIEITKEGAIHERFKAIFNYFDDIEDAHKEKEGELITADNLEKMYLAYKKAPTQDYGTVGPYFRAIDNEFDRIEDELGIAADELEQRFLAELSKRHTVETQPQPESIETASLDFPINTEFQLDNGNNCKVITPPLVDKGILYIRYATVVDGLRQTSSISISELRRRVKSINRPEKEASPTATASAQAETQTTLEEITLPPLEPTFEITPENAEEEIKKWLEDPNDKRKLWVIHQGKILNNYIKNSLSYDSNSQAILLDGKENFSFKDYPGAKLSLATELSREVVYQNTNSLKRTIEACKQFIEAFNHSENKIEYLKDIGDSLTRNLLNFGYLSDYENGNFRKTIDSGVITDDSPEASYFKAQISEAREIFKKIEAFGVRTYIPDQTQETQSLLKNGEISISLYAEPWKNDIPSRNGRVATILTPGLEYINPTTSKREIAIPAVAVLYADAPVSAEAAPEQNEYMQKYGDRIIHDTFEVPGQPNYTGYAEVNTITPIPGTKNVRIEFYLKKDDNSSVTDETNNYVMGYKTITDSVDNYFAKHPDQSSKFNQMGGSETTHQEPELGSIDNKNILETGEIYDQNKYETIDQATNQLNQALKNLVEKNQESNFKEALQGWFDKGGKLRVGDRVYGPDDIFVHATGPLSEKDGRPYIGLTIVLKNNKTLSFRPDQPDVALIIEKSLEPQENPLTQAEQITDWNNQEQVEKVYPVGSKLKGNFRYMQSETGEKDWVIQKYNKTSSDQLLVVLKSGDKTIAPPAKELEKGQSIS